VFAVGFAVAVALALAVAAPVDRLAAFPGPPAGPGGDLDRRPISEMSTLFGPRYYGYRTTIQLSLARV